jgi:Zn-dependent peptidase ImmA (M78 family)
LTVEQNISRLQYLLELYNISGKELSSIISKGLKNPLIYEDIFSREIKINHLKRIDKVFNKGLPYYLDPARPETSKDASIFFRKEKFNSDLNIGARKIVNEFEEIKISLSAISKLSDLNTDRMFRLYKISDNPREVAKEIRNRLYPDFTNNLKEFLKSLISKFADNNILVFEFVETWNKKEKANINGFFLGPNVIVLKRQQTSFRREVFTLIHELGHFLINEEEIEKLEYQQIGRKDVSAIEKWCNEFAFQFLAGAYGKLLDELVPADTTNDYHFAFIEQVSKKTNLSQIALFTRLLYDNKITQFNYNKVKSDFDERYRLKLEDEKRRIEIEKQKGLPQRGSAPKPIQSPLYISTIQAAFAEGILNEYEVCQKLKIKPEKLEKYIS